MSQESRETQKQGCRMAYKEILDKAHEIGKNDKKASEIFD